MDGEYYIIECTSLATPRSFGKVVPPVPASVSAPVRRVWLRRGDLLVAGAVLLLALGLLLGTRLFAKPGAAAVVTTAQGSFTLPLGQDATRALTGKGGIRVTLEVAGGRVRFAASDCPDKVCVHSGWLSRSGQTAACVPAGIAVRVTGGEAAGIDAVVQ